MSKSLENLNSISIFFHTNNDAPEPWGLFFPDNTSPHMEGLEELHNNIMFYLSIILFAVSWIMLSVILNYKKAFLSNRYVNQITLDSVLGIIPALILLIALPSFKLLYLIEEVIDPSLVIYGKGHPWYSLSQGWMDTIMNEDIPILEPQPTPFIPLTNNERLSPVHLYLTKFVGQDYYFLYSSENNLNFKQYLVFGDQTYNDGVYGQKNGVVIPKDKIRRCTVDYLSGYALPGDIQI